VKLTNLQPELEKQLRNRSVLIEFDTSWDSSFLRWATRRMISSKVPKDSLSQLLIPIARYWSSRNSPTVAIGIAINSMDILNIPLTKKFRSICMPKPGP